MDAKLVLEKDRELLQLPSAERPLYDMFAADSELPWKKMSPQQATSPYFGLRATPNWRKKVLKPRKSVQAMRELYYLLFDGMPPKIASNVVIAGGAVFHCAYEMQYPVKIHDVDIFIHGRIVDERDFAQTLTNHIVKNFGATSVRRSASAITFTGLQDDLPCDSIQIILRIYENVPHILYGFDMQCAALALLPPSDRSAEFKCVGTSLAVYTRKTGCMVVDTSRRSLTFEKRLNKYAARGVQLILPYFDSYGVWLQYLYPNVWINYVGYVYQGKRAVLATGYRQFAMGNGTHLSIGERVKETNTWKGVFVKPVRRAEIRLSAQDYSYAKFNVSNINKQRVAAAITAGSKEQPDLFLRVDPKNVFGVIDLREYEDVQTFVYEPITTTYKKLMSDAEIAALPFTPLYKPKFRTLAPDAQWSASFDPVSATPIEWYGETHYTDTPSEVRTTEFDFYDAKDWYKDKLSIANCMLTVRKGEVPVPFTDKLAEAYADNQLIFEIFRYAYGMDARRNKFARFDAKDWIRNLSVIYRIAKVTPRRIQSKAVGLESIFNDYIGSMIGIGALRKFVMPAQSPGWIWQKLCALGVPAQRTALIRQMHLFDVPKDKDLSLFDIRALCALLAHITDRIESTSFPPGFVCENPDDFDLLYTAEMKNTPHYLRYVKIGANGKNYCYNLYDMLQLIQNGIERDPRGNTLTRDDEYRVTMDTNRLRVTRSDPEDPRLAGTNMTLAERFAELESTNVLSDSRKLAELVETIDYPALTPDELLLLTFEELVLIIDIAENGQERQLIDNEIRPVDKAGCIDLLYRYSKKRSFNPTLIAFAFGTFVEGNADRVRDIRAEILQRRAQDAEM